MEETIRGHTYTHTHRVPSEEGRTGLRLWSPHAGEAAEVVVVVLAESEYFSSTPPPLTRSLAPRLRIQMRTLARRQQRTGGGRADERTGGGRERVVQEIFK